VNSPQALLVLTTVFTGTPNQEFIGIFDTASPVTWVMSDQCTSSACLAEPDSEKFHASQSSTNYKFPLRVDLSYLDGTHVQLKPELVSAD